MDPEAADEAMVTWPIAISAREFTGLTQFYIQPYAYIYSSERMGLPS